MKLTLPENWNEVKLSDYLEYWKRIKPYLNAEDNDLLNNVAIDNALVHMFKIPLETLKTLDANDAMMLKMEAAKLLAQSTNIPLVRFFTMEVDGETIEFGFEPNLDEMSYGCYLDLAEASKDLWDNIYTFLATLYRPVVSKAGKRYRIAEYEGTDFSMIPYFKNALTADIALGSVFFFREFTKGLIERYDGLFGEDTEVKERFGVQSAWQALSSKYGGFSSLLVLSGDDITKLNAVADLPIHTCLTTLQYQKERSDIEKAEYDRINRNNRR